MPRKGENIYKRKDGRWEGRYMKARDTDGKAIYGYVYAKSYRDAKTKLVQASAAQSTTNMGHQENSLLFQSAADSWMEAIRVKIKESTSIKYQNLLHSYIFPKIGALPIRSVSCAFMEEYCNELLLHGGASGSGLSAKTVSDVLSVIRSVLKFAARYDHQIVCDIRDVQVKHTTKEICVLTRSEQDQLCQYLYSNINAYNIGILVSLFTGLRIGEVCALRWEDISLYDQTIYVCKTMQRIQDQSGVGNKTKIIVTPPKSSHSIRLIPIPMNLLQVIAAFQETQEGYFLTNSTEKYIEPRILEYHFKNVLKQCGLREINYHALRHTFATRCVEAGFDIKTLSEILGHASVDITMNRYVHPSMELKRENMQKLSLLSPSSKAV